MVACSGINDGQGICLCVCLHNQHQTATGLLPLNSLAHRALCCMVQGRDANRKLQRSIKAGKQRERMPGLVEQLRQVLTHWQMEHRQPFTYDGWDYKVSVACAHSLCSYTGRANHEPVTGLTLCPTMRTRQIQLVQG